MVWLKNYVTSIIAVSVVGLILDCLLNEGNLKKYAMFGVSLVLSICLIQPVVNNNIEINVPEISNIEYTVDYKTAVKSTVNSVSGFENADVSVIQEKNKILSITIKNSKDKMLEEAISEATESYVKNLVSAIYNVEKDNIYFAE